MSRGIIMDIIKIELCAAEGGADAKLLVNDLTDIYVRFCKKQNYSVKSMKRGDGTCTLIVEGVDAYSKFQNESGGHRWQRVPPTERNGRVHTSTVTVAVSHNKQQQHVTLDPADVEESFMRGSGKGGQHRNKTSTACRLKHIPSGLTVRVESERSQAQNRALAWSELEKRLNNIALDKSIVALNIDRKKQMGTGQRGDKKRTYRERDDIVTDHVTGNKASYTRILKGELELLW